MCAASLADVEKALGEWIGARPKVVSLDPRTLGDVWGDMGRVAEALGAPERGRDLAERLAQRVAAVSERTQRIRERPSVACVEWIDPLMAAGNWMPELVALAGGRNLFGDPGSDSPWLDWETLRAADPDVIVVLPCGFDLPRTRVELPPLPAQPGWAELRAVENGHVLPHRRQPVLQPTRTAPGRVARAPGRDPASGRVPAEPPRRRLAAASGGVLTLPPHSALASRT